ncbi:MAG TPA: hypothetical protein VGF99_16575 [Myxococcota bacterium]
MPTDDSLCTDCDDGLCDEATGVCGENECDVVGEACDTGTYCTGGRCERTCEAPVARGERCFEQADEGGSCPFSATCADGLICSVNTGGEAFFGDCVPPTNRAVGERCGDDTSSCGAGLVCSVDEHCVVDDG